MIDSSSDRNPVERLAEEFAERHRRGERPSLTEYTDKYPQWADEIRELFPALVMMEQLKPGTADATGTYAGASLSEGQKLERLGDYRILREVGRGGMGIVYEAEQESLGRHVALKVLPAHALLDPRQLHRFRREAKAAARLHHTNIVPVYGVGEHDGIQYYVMQFIQGLGLDQVLVELKRLRQAKGLAVGAQDGRTNGQAGPLSAAAVAQSLLTGQFTRTAAPAAPAAEEPSDPSPAPAKQPGEPASGAADGLRTGPQSSDGSGTQSGSSSSIHLPGHPEHSPLSDSGRHYWQSVARIGLQVAEALAYAHGQGTLHRDIKPSNLLLDTQGTVWVTDFGLAKAVADQDNLTTPGDILGTLRYMAPERFLGRSDARGDVYGLGLTLYELLAFRSAFEESDRNRLIHQLTHEEPPPLRRLNPQVPRDLETIIHKAVARDPEHRYATAAELAGDLRRFLEDKPILARRVSLRERFWRWCRRNPAIAGLTATALVLLVAVAVVATVGYVQTSAALRRERQAQEGAATAKEAARIAKEQEKAAKELEKAAKLRATEETNKAAGARKKYKRYFTDLARQCLERGLRLCTQEGKVDEGMLWMARSLRFAPDDEEALQQAIRANLAGWQPRLAGHRLRVPQPITAVVFSRDGKVLVTAGGVEAQRRNPATGVPIGEPLRQSGYIQAVAISPDGKTIVTASPQEASLWDAATGKPVGEPLRFRGAIYSIRCSPNARTVAVCSQDPTTSFPNIQLWDVATRAPIGESIPQPAGVPATDFSPDGKTLLTRNSQELWLLNAATGKPLGQPLRGVYNAVFSPDSRTVLTVQWNGMTYEAQLHAVPSGTPLGKPFSVVTMYHPLAVSPGGKRVVMSNYQQIQLWDPTTGTAVGEPRQHAANAFYSIFSPDGRTYVILSRQGAQLCDAATGATLGEPFQHTGQVRVAAFHPNSHSLLTASWTSSMTKGQYRQWSEMHIWNLTERFGQTLPCKGPVEAVAFNRDGTRAATACRDGSIQVWDAATGKPVGKPLRPLHPVRALAWSPDGKYLLTGGSNPAGTAGEARLRRADTGDAIGMPLTHPVTIVAVAFHPDGRVFLTAGGDKSVRVWDTGAPERPTKLLPHRAPVTAAAWSPNGRQVLTVCTDHTLWLWNAATGKPVRNIRVEDADAVSILGFAADGKTFLTASNDAKKERAVIQRWDADSMTRQGEPLAQGAIAVATVSRDGKVVVTAGQDGRVRVWDMAAATPVAPPLPLMVKPQALAVSPDGQTILAGCADQTARLWKRPPTIEGNEQKISLWTEVITGLELNADDRVEPLTEAVLEQRRLNLEALQTPQRKTGPEKLARLYARLGQWDKAIAEYARAIKQHPKDIELRIERGRVYAQRKQWTQAVADFTTALQEKKADPQLWSDRGRAYIGQEDWKHAADDFTRASSLRPDDPDLHLERGRAFAHLGQTNPAADAFLRVLELYQNNPAQRGPTFAALVAWDKVFARMAELRPEDAQLWTGRAQAHMQRKDWAKAAADFAKAIQLAPRDYRLRIERARTCLQLKRWDEAAADMAEALRLAGKNAYQRAPVYALLAQWDDAFQRTVALRPDDDQLWMVHGEGLARKEQWDKAVADFNRALSLAPDNVACRLDRARAYVRLRRWDQAAADYAQALRLSERNPGARTTYCREVMQSDQVFDKVAALQPSNAELWLVRGRERLRQARWEQAAADYAKALEVLADQTAERIKAAGELGPWPQALAKAVALRPKDWVLWQAQGNAHALSHQWPQAAGDYARAAELAPDNAEVAHHQACALLQAGDTAGYRDVCAGLLKRFADSKDPSTAYWVARTGTLAPGAVADPARLVELGKRALASHPKDSPTSHAYLLTLGAASYRAGRFEEAVRQLHEAMAEQYSREGNEAVFDWLWLAMTHQRLKRSGKPQECLDKFKQVIERHKRTTYKTDVLNLSLPWEDRLEYQFLAAEATALVQPHIAALERARNYVRRGAWDKAATEFTEVLRLRNDDPHYWLERGQAYGRLSRWDEAAADLVKALEPAPQQPGLANEVYDQLKRWPRALCKAADLRPGDAVLRRERGELLVGYGLWDAAAADLKQAFAQQPPANPLDWYFHACARLAVGDQAGYRKIWAQMLKRFGEREDQTAPYLLARAGTRAPLASEDAQRLVDLANRGGLNNPNSYLYVRGAAYYRAGQFKEAIRRFHECMEAVPAWDGNVLNWLMLAMAHECLGQHKNARQWFDKGRQRIDEAVQQCLEKGTTRPLRSGMDWLECQLLLREAKGLFKDARVPDAARIHVLRARACIRLGQNDWAADQFAQAAKLRPDDLFLRIERGRFHHARAEWDDAAADLTKALAQKDEDRSLHLDRGRAYAHLGRWDDAGADFARALELLLPISPERSRIHAELARWPRAFTKTASLRPKDARLWIDQGLFYAERGLWDDAAAGIAKGFALDPPKSAIQWLSQATLRLLAGDMEGYRKACGRMLKFSDVSTAFETARACSLAPKAIADPLQVVQLAEKVVAARPRVAWHLHVLGRAHYRAGQFDQAIRRLHESLEVNPTWNARALDWLVLAMAHQHLGQKKEARQWLDQATKWLEQAARDNATKAPGNLPVAWWDWAELQLLRREAEILIKGAAAEDDANLHIARGRAYAQLGLADRAGTEYARAAKAKPDDPELRINRGQLHILLGKWDKAAADYAKVIDSLKFHDTAFEYACLRLLTGDRQGYEKLCAQVVKEHGATKDPFTAYVAARIGALTPKVVVESSLLEEWAQHAVASRPLARYYLHALGLAHYRAGHDRRALRRFHESIRSSPDWTGNALNWLGLALVHHRLGHAEEARKWFDKARKWSDQMARAGTVAVATVHPASWLEFQVLRRETEDSIKSNSTPK
jgi:tetratricopeptide (TPR) repeat protein/WD40 repeat protein/serine/threonine protein kinase